MKWLTKQELFRAAFIAVLMFHIAFTVEAMAGLAMFLYLGALVTLTKAPTSKKAFGVGWLVGVACFAPQSAFFWTFRGPIGAMMWAILGLFTATFLWLGRSILDRSPRYGMYFLPIIWLGLEWFRCEHVYSGLTPGHTLVSLTWSWLLSWGALGIGGVVVLAHSARLSPSRVVRVVTPIVIGVGLAITLAATFHPNSTDPAASDDSLKVACVQVEGYLSQGKVVSPSESQLLAGLNRAKARFHEADVFVTPEYATEAEPTPAIVKWSWENQKVVIVSGRKYLPNGQFYNTAFAVKPGGSPWSQGKRRPIPFANDGLPTETQHIWWDGYGPIGILICYDLSFPSVVDELVSQGAGVLIAPSLNFASWGADEHRKQLQLARAVAAEHGMSVVRADSSGYSAIIDPRGQVVSMAPFSGEPATIGGDVEFATSISIPPDRFAYKPAALTTIAVLGWFVVTGLSWQWRALPAWRRRRKARKLWRTVGQRRFKDRNTP